jgi:hypothetical protein
MSNIQTPDAEGWCKWAGGECPVDPQSTVQIRLREGLIGDSQAGNVSWQHLGNDVDVIEYRMSRAPKQGDCDLCGKWSGNLIDAACDPCREKYKP